MSTSRWGRPGLVEAVREAVAVRDEGWILPSSWCGPSLGVFVGGGDEKAVAHFVSGAVGLLHLGATEVTRVRRAGRVHCSTRFGAISGRRRSRPGSG